MAGLIDERRGALARRLIGGQLTPSPVAVRGTRKMSDLHRPAWTKVTRCGEDDLYQLRLHDAAGRSAKKGGDDVELDL